MIKEQTIARRYIKAFTTGYEKCQKEHEWHDNEKEPIPTEDNWNKDYVVRLYNGNKRIVFWSTHTFKDCVTGEHIPLDTIKLWILLPKETKE